MVRKKILCYGDSNTWGYIPGGFGRFPEDVRWPGVLRSCLKDDFDVIEDGLNGRSVFSFYPNGDPLNGEEHFGQCRRAYLPLDYIIFFLGINDIFGASNITVDEISQKVCEILGPVVDEKNTHTEIVLLSPVPVNKNFSGSGMYMVEINKSLEFAGTFMLIAESLGCKFIDTSGIIESSSTDGVHLDGKSHIILGQTVCRLIKT
jgi:lysophospholipase L1-like esterase